MAGFPAGMDLHRGSRGRAHPVGIIPDGYSFQFPAWLQGDHVLEIDYVDHTIDYRWTIRNDLTTHHGGGYQAATPTAVASGASSPAPIRETHLHKAGGLETGS